MTGVQTCALPISAPEKLGAATAVLADEANELLLSAASAWEISIKWGLGRIPLPEKPAFYVPSRMNLTGVKALPVSHAHALQVAELVRHHGDPFDRLLVAQSQVENITLITGDSALRPYEISVLWL